MALLSAISVHCAGYGLILVLAFGLGRISALTAVGLAPIHARRFIKKPDVIARSSAALECFLALTSQIFAREAICSDAVSQRADRSRRIHFGLRPCCCLRQAE